MKLFENVVNYKINNITYEDILKYSKQFNIKISTEQAKKVAGLVRGKGVNIFNDKERAQLIKEIAKITGPAVAKEVNQLFIQFTK
ncbi:MAG TPA: DUF2624 domain-containing protein [Bacillus sp. (in: firmicutes)]|uniref:DUF2624 domain-containing protein n=1 Tax=Bacillus litorisediminis TaxID=2922713 RepID=UPI001FAE5CF2|nr:DUF2624 domain-containing protein [Bacillus litorisediminis]HWO77663.1 DUF2624 domain-containing protein [Bacillus sp. (in: firmicutes)]